MLSGAGASVSPAAATDRASTFPGSAGAAAEVAARAPSTARPLISVPGYGHRDGYRARIRPGNGDTETKLALRVGRSGHLVWGDWWNRGTQTPAVFRRGVWRLYGAGFGHPTVRATVRFGRRGDVPVVGDWNGDGRTDLATVRDGTWRLAVHRTTRPRTWRKFAFGPRDGQPVAGDWDGAGPDGIGMYRAGKWWVKQTAKRRARVRKATFAFHRKRPGTNAAAVAGDWNGNGRAGVALVRGDRWKFAPRIGARRGQVSTRRITRRAGEKPVVWTQAGGARGGFCPTATGRTGPSVTTTTPPGLQVEPGPPDAPPAPSKALVREALLRAERFTLASRSTVPWAARPGQTHVDVLAGDRRQEYAVRRPAMAAMAVAVAVATGAHNDTDAGAGRNAAVRYVEQAARSIACQHLSVSPGGWGHGWQTGHWAQLTALAAWLVWDELAPATRADVTAMLLDEADHQLTLPAEYWRDRDGNVLPGREGNTAAEEMAWDVALLELARTMFPGASRAREYRRHAVQWAVASYATPADLHDPAPVNGVALEQRLRGSNALDDGTVVNHDRVEPDYMGNIQHLWWAADFALLARTTTPEAVWSNARKVYGAFSTVEFVPGTPSAAGNGRTYVEPGGTIYRPEADAVYFPDGTAWGTARRAPFVSIDAHAQSYDLAPAAAWPAADALDSHVSGQLALSKASGDSGRTYSPNPAIAATQDTYQGREEYAAQQIASAWLVLHLAAGGPPPVDDALYPVPDDAHERQPRAPRRSASP